MFLKQEKKKKRKKKKKKSREKRMVFSEPYFENRGRFLEAGPKEFSHPESRT